MQKYIEESANKSNERGPRKIKNLVNIWEEKKKGIEEE
jgi:hypothetical protein